MNLIFIYCFTANFTAMSIFIETMLTPTFVTNSIYIICINTSAATITGCK